MMKAFRDFEASTLQRFKLSEILMLPQKLGKSSEINFTQTF